jgi:hypothetical protein
MLLNWCCRFLKKPVNTKGFIGGAAGNAERAGNGLAALVMKTKTAARKRTEA